MLTLRFMRLSYLIIFLGLLSQAPLVSANPCLDGVVDSDRRDLCLSYLNEEFEVRGELKTSFLNYKRVISCEDNFFNTPKSYNMCLRVASRAERMEPQKIRACAKKFYWAWSEKICLKLAPLMSLREINQCGEDSKWPVDSITCFAEASFPQPLEYLERIESD